MGIPVESLVGSPNFPTCVHFVQKSQLKHFRALRKSGFEVMELDRDDLASPRTLMYALARAFRFPDWGENWNALYDFLSDLRWIDADRFVLVVHDVGRHGLSEPVGRLSRRLSTPRTTWPRSSAPSTWSC